MPLDYYFSYNNHIRFLILQKIGKINNTFMMPKILKIKLYFSINKILFLDSSSYFNCAYLFRFFLGKRTFFSKITSQYGFNESYHSFNIMTYFHDNFLKYSTIFYLVNDILPYVAKSYIKKMYKEELNIFNLSILDVNIFSEKKTNLGLFSLEDSLIFSFLLKCSSRIDAIVLLSSLKILW